MTQPRKRGFFSRLFGGKDAEKPSPPPTRQPKAPPPAGPATHPDERGPEERAPGTRKNGSPDDVRPRKRAKKPSKKHETLAAPPPHAPHPIQADKPEEHSPKGPTKH
jgi:hypothetical protein